jgi:hypothetical protein
VRPAGAGYDSCRDGITAGAPLLGTGWGQLEKGVGKQEPVSLRQPASSGSKCFASVQHFDENFYFDKYHYFSLLVLILYLRDPFQPFRLAAPANIASS